MADDCSFCAIAEGVAPAERVYEDDAAVAIMGIQPGHPRAR